MKYFKNMIIMLVIAISPITVYSQGANIDLKSDSIPEWPYRLPIWGDKLAEKNISFPLPVGASVSYISSSMDLDISEFGMSIGDNNIDLSEWVNEETLGFHDVTAGVNGANYRVDSWLLPFMNVYGMFNNLKGYTDVNLKPLDELPSFSSRAEFTAYAYGFGATFSYGVNNWFYTLDFNRSWTSSEILHGDVGVAVSSFRIGKQFLLKNGDKIALYAGFMYRDFINHTPVTGKVVLGELYPELEAQYDQWYSELSPVEKRLLDQFKEPILDAIGNENIFESPINYRIKKDLVKNYTFQFGTSYDITKHWSYRAELGISKHQYMLITGFNYRFGFKKSS